MSDDIAEELGWFIAERRDQHPRVATDMDSLDLASDIVASKWFSQRIAEAKVKALDEVERRIRHQASAAQVGSMEWRAHFADLAHIEDIRRGA